MSDEIVGPTNSIVLPGEEMRIDDVAVEAKPVNPLHQVHDLLRGRYWIASILAIVGLAVGSLVGYRIPSPMYESAGLIRIKPNLPRILYQNEQNGGVMPMFDAYVQSEVALIMSQRVTDVAMQDPAWVALHRGLTPKDIQKFDTSLTVVHPNNSELIQLTFDDYDPEAARIAIAATIDAYLRLYGENETDSATQRLQVLEDHRVQLSNELKGLNDRLLAISNEYGSNTLDKIYQFKLGELNNLESQLQDAELATADARSEDHAPTTAPSPMIDELLALKSPDIRELLTSKRDLERQLAVDTLRLGNGNLSVVELKATLDTVNQQIEKLSDAYRKLGPDALGSSTTSDPLDGTKSLAYLQSEEKNIRAMYDSAKAETVEMGKKCVEIDSIHNDADALKARLDETQQRIEQINLESSVGGRLTVESKGDQPLTPIKDKRLAAAVGGGCGMAVFGVGLVVLFGLINRRVRHISDVRQGLPSANRILGVLPAIPETLDPEAAAVAAHSVHHIRTQLQHRRGRDEKPVFVVTSPSAGAGKTSLVQALGLSFAASGSKTLLIDCDIVGGGLTARLKTTIHRRLGRVLRRKGLINDKQLTEAVKTARQSGRLVGEVLIEMGVVSESQVQEAIASQPDTSVGLLEALNGDPIGECIAGTGITNLYMMPLGSAQRHHVGQISYAGLRGIIEQARGFFDVVLIDTGPVLGSLEASVSAMVADQVILTVSRGEQTATLDRAINYLVSSGSNIAGLVLNRVDNEDIWASGYSSSSHLSNESPKGPRTFESDLQSSEQSSLRLNPIGSAVFALTDSISRR